jgi:basic membrane protein A
MNGSPAAPTSINPHRWSPNMNAGFRPNRRDTMKSLTALGATTALGGWGLLANAQTPLTVGVIYVGPRDDYGYNQAQAQAAAELRKMPGINCLEKENVH